MILLFTQSSCRRLVAALLILVWVASTQTQPANGDQAVDHDPPLILAHYMPWYVAPPAAGAWGWHWTMNHFDPRKVTGGKRDIASHFYPLIGPYDSGDQHVLEYQLLLMKLAGIDGVIIDWYGRQDFRDYAILHRNTQRFVTQASRLGMKFAICYEDQTIGALVDAGRLKPDAPVDHATTELSWLAQNWFSKPNYVRLDGRPVLLSFGQTGLSGDQWTAVLSKLKTKVAYFSQHHRREAAIGAFDWPVPTKGLAAIENFHDASSPWPQSIPVAFPRFVDIYAEAKVHESWGRIEDNDGQTFHQSLKMALQQQQPLIQIATWNDWGEGTSIEPSVEFGYRDLESIQRMRRKQIEPGFAFVAADLRLPQRLLQLRRENTHDAGQLDRIAQSIAMGDPAAADRAIRQLANRQRQDPRPELKK